MAAFRTLDDAGDLKGKRVLLRVDLNVPVKDGAVTDATRIERVAPTIKELSDRGAKVALLAHFERPKGKRVPEMSLAPIAAAVAEVVGRPVGFVDDCIGPEAEAAVAKLGDGGIVLLENTRFHAGEEDERSGLRRGAREGRRHLRERRLLRRAPRACLDRGPRAPPARLCRARDAGGAGGAREGARPTRAHRCSPSSAAPKISTKLELLGNLIRKVDALVIGGAHGEHVPRREGRRDRQIAERAGPASTRRSRSCSRRRSAAARSCFPPTWSSHPSSRRTRRTRPCAATRCRPTG